MNSEVVTISVVGINQFKMIRLIVGASVQKGVLDELQFYSFCQAWREVVRPFAKLGKTIKLWLIFLRKQLLLQLAN